jgi:AraC-like DNA-binding protein/CheY-like chemotaxis protein
VIEFNSKRQLRYDLVAAAHDFILAVLPFRHPDSRSALARFLDCASRTRISVPETDAVLLDVLSVLNIHARCAGLLDRYVAERRHSAAPLARFRECVEDVIRSRGIGNRRVERAIALVDVRYTDDTLTQAQVADHVGLAAGDFSTRFKRHTGVTFTEHLRNIRLHAAASLLATTDRRVKDIWGAVGYGDASNFDHQFKRRFTMTPRDYRRDSARQIATASPTPPTPWTTAREAGSHVLSGFGTVLIVEDNDNTRETVGRYLRAMGYEVVLASTGEDGLGVACRLGPRVVVLDYHLPDMDGLTWLRALRLREHEFRAGVLLFTADWEVADHIEEIDALGAKFLSKLCDIDELLELIATSAPRSDLRSSSEVPKRPN